jgi:DNA-binding XRE family transcriptional regulator
MASGCSVGSSVRARKQGSAVTTSLAIGVHYQTVGYLERGEYSPSLVLALRIARLLDLPVETLFSLDPLPESVPADQPPLKKEP